MSVSLQASCNGSNASTTHLEVDPLIRLTDAWQTSEQILLLDERVAQDHEQTADDAHVSEEEVEVKDETVAEALYDDDA